jgi:hypothetical protein
MHLFVCRRKNTILKMKPSFGKCMVLQAVLPRFYALGLPNSILNRWNQEKCDCRFNEGQIFLNPDTDTAGLFKQIKRYNTLCHEDLDHKDNTLTSPALIPGRGHS